MSDTTETAQQGFTLPHYEADPVAWLCDELDASYAVRHAEVSTNPNEPNTVLLVMMNGKRRTVIIS